MNIACNLKAILSSRVVLWGGGYEGWVEGESLPFKKSLYAQTVDGEVVKDGFRTLFYPVSFNGVSPVN